MIPFRLDMARMPLDVWGRPEDIGAHTLQGPMTVSGKILFGSLDSPVSGGLYAASRGRYRVVYPFDEHATLLDGQLRLTDVAQAAVDGTLDPLAWAAPPPRRPAGRAGGRRTAPDPGS